MKKIISVLFFTALASLVSAQALEEFYNKSFEIFSPFGKITAKSASMDTLGMKNGPVFWGIVDIGSRYSNTKRWGMSVDISTRQIGDLFYILHGLLGNGEKQRNFRDQYYLSDLGFLPNLRFGLNVFARDNMVINVGLYNSYYISYAGFLKNGYMSYKNIHLLSAGPNVYLDRSVNEWLAFRVSTGPMLPYVVSPDEIKETDNKPKLWESKIELFTKWGFFAGADILNLRGYHDDKESNMKVRRVDLKFGVRIKM